MNLNVLGYAGAGIIALAAPFQLEKCWRTQSTRDLSWIWIGQYYSGIVMLWIYAFYYNIKPVWIPLSLEVASATFLFLLKIKLDIIYHKHYTEESETQYSEDDFLLETSSEIKILYARERQPTDDEATKQEIQMRQNSTKVLIAPDNKFNYSAI